MKELKLSNDQKQALDRVEEILLSGSKVATLRGFAGVGKTTLMREVVNRLGPEFNQIYMMAPTHKAAEVLRRKTGYEVSTIHSAFGMRPVWDGEGGYKFVPTGEKPKDFIWKSLIAIDEASMVNGQLYDLLTEAQSDFNLSILFVGDPAQLPPVNEAPSPALSHEGYTMKEIVRQEKGNPIIQTSMNVRENHLHDFVEKTNKGKGVHVTGDLEEVVERAVSDFQTEKHKKTGDYARLLAYRNDTVNDYNDIFRALIYGEEAPQFVKNEWLVAMEPWFQGQNPVPVIQNSEEFVVKGKEPSKNFGYRTWILEIANDLQGTNLRHVEVLDERDRERYDQQLQELLEKAKKNNRFWSKYYDFKEMFANVDYNYAMTVHKAQGSTFHTTYLDVPDVMTCRSKRDKKGLMYVGVTRASDVLWVYDG